MSGGWEDWEWDETLFRGAAQHYVLGRLPYAPGLSDALATALDLSNGPRLLDVGCGPGTVAFALADRFEEVVGVDADGEMVATAERQAAERGITASRWVQLRAENLPAGLGLFRAITFGASFHWMDRPRVARIVRDMLDPAGAVVHVDNRHQDALPETSLPAVPRPRIDDLRREYLGPDRRAGASIRNTSPGDEDAVFRAAGFIGPEEVVVPDGRELRRSVDEVVSEVFSNSATTPHLLGGDAPAFERDLRRILEETAGPAGHFGVRLPGNVLRVWRPPPTR